jgi:hypothetical protein
MKIRPMEVELYADGRTDGQKDMTWPIVAFRNFVNTPIEFPYNTLQIKNSYWYRHINRVPRYMP